MSYQSKEEYLESCRARYLGRNRAGKGAMIDEVSDVFGWERKHAIKALNGQVALGSKAQKRGSKKTYGPAETEVIIMIWRLSEQPCGVRLKATLPIWLESYQNRHGELSEEVCQGILSYSARTLERITAPYRASGEGGRIGRKTGRTSNRLKVLVPVQCGPQEVDRPGYLEADTVSHGGGSSSGEFLNSLTLTDLHTGWTELAALWGSRGSEVRVGLEKIEKRMPFELLGFDCDNGSEFLNETLEDYLLTREQKPRWTRSRPYKKNDQAHVEQKNFTHVRQLLGYGRYDDLSLKELVDDLYENAWLPLRNHFTPVMKLIEKHRQGSKVIKKYDQPQTPCDRLLACPQVPESTKEKLRSERAGLDAIELSELVEQKLRELHRRVDLLEEDRQEQMRMAGEIKTRKGPMTGGGGDLQESAPPVATAPCGADSCKSEEELAKRA